MTRSKQVIMHPQDSLMKLRPSKHEVKPKDTSAYFSVVATKLSGEEILVSDFEHNVFPAGCVDLIHTDMFTTTSKSGSGFNNIALTADTGQTINAAQTALTGEITANGLARVQAGTRTHTAGTNTTLIEHTFTLTGTQSDITRAALFNVATAPVSGTMGPFAAFTNGATGQMVNGETLKVSITITTS
jgi:hypothetical protein